MTVGELQEILNQYPGNIEITIGTFHHDIEDVVKRHVTINGQGKTVINIIDEEQSGFI